MTKVLSIDSIMYYYRYHGNVKGDKRNVVVAVDDDNVE
jgi:hypothetical protein